MLGVLGVGWSPVVAEASGWVKDPGSAYVKAAVGAFTSEESQEGAGLRYVNQSTRLYAEVGVLEGMHLLVDGEYVWAANEVTGTDVRYVHNGFGDLKLGVRYRLLTEPAAVALGVDVKTPLYKPVAEVDGAEAMGDTTQFPDLGDGATDVTVGLGAGWSLHPLPMWAGAWTGYQRRGGSFRDTAVASATAGGTLAALVGLSVGLDAAYALKDDDLTKSWLMVQTTAWIELPGGVAPELFYGFMPWTRNTESGMQLLLGMSWKR